MGIRRRLLRLRRRSRVALLLSLACFLLWGMSAWGVIEYSGQFSLVLIGHGRFSITKVFSPWLQNPSPAGWRVGSHREFTYSAFKDEFGRLIFNVLPEGYSTSHPHLVRSDAWRRLYRDLGLRWPVFEREKDPFGVLYYSQLDIPVWMLALPVWLTTLFFLIRGRRRSAECCDECGYCLRGVESGVCPECGEPVQVDMGGLTRFGNATQCGSAN